MMGAWVPCFYDITQGSPTVNIDVGSIGYVGRMGCCCFCCCCFWMALVIERVCIFVVCGCCICGCICFNFICDKIELFFEMFCVFILIQYNTMVSKSNTMIGVMFLGGVLQGYSFLGLGGGGLGRFRPLNLIVSSRAVVSSLVQNINMEVISYDNILAQTNELVSQMDLSVSSFMDSHTLNLYLYMVVMFSYYLWAYLDAYSLETGNKRLEGFTGFTVSRKITNQVCLVFIFVFTKDVLYAF
jgi:hypothetical protein